MNKYLLFFLPFLLVASGTIAQTPIINSWVMNTSNIAKYYNTSGTLVSTGKISDINQLCYSTDSVWIKTTGMPSIFGPWSNPGTPTDQNFTFRFPKNPSADATPTTVPTVFAVGALITGVPVFGNGDSRSWKNSTSSNTNNGDGLWNGNAYYTEGVSLDTTYAGHVNQDGTYHSHATPFKLYKNFSSTVHSPLVGFAFDGYPIYGPFGYTSAMDNTSPIKRMASSYQLKSIANRNSTSPAGPPINSTYPLGYYIEDYGYVAGLGDLDAHNGRLCVTPEYPGGTYAYFVTTETNGDPKFPYYIGSTYYGVTDEANLSPVSTISIPASGTSCSALAVLSPKESQFNISPNPVQSQLHIEMDATLGIKDFEITISNSLGEIIFKNLAEANFELSSLAPGLYMITLSNPYTGISEVQKFIKQ